MKSYRELVRMAEAAVDELMETPGTALQKNIIDIMDVLGVMIEKSDSEPYPLTMEERAALYAKMGGYMDRLIESALCAKNEYGKTYGFSALHLFIEIKEALALLETMPTPAGKKRMCFKDGKATFEKV